MTIWFESINDFIFMHGYGRYVWPTWGAALLLLGGQVVHARRERNRRIKQWQQDQTRQALANPAKAIGLDEERS